MKEQDLTLVGLTEDKQQLVLVSDSGEEFTLPADARLRAALRGEHARLGQLEITMESALRPRDIQARIRAGESPESVAAGRPDQRREDHGLRHAGAGRARPRRRPGAARVGAPQGRRRARPGSLGDAVAERLRAPQRRPRQRSSGTPGAARTAAGRWSPTTAPASAAARRVRLRRPRPLRRGRGRRGPLAGRRADRSSKGPSRATTRAGPPAPALRGRRRRGAAAGRGRDRDGQPSPAGADERHRAGLQPASPGRAPPRPRRHRRRRLDRHPGQRAPGAGGARSGPTEVAEPADGRGRAEPAERSRARPSPRTSRRPARTAREEAARRCRAGTRSCSAAASASDRRPGPPAASANRVTCQYVTGHVLLRHRRDRVHRPAPRPGAARQPRGRDLRPGPRGLAGPDGARCCAPGAPTAS